MSPDVTHMTAAGIARRIRDSDLSPVEVVDATLEAIEERNERTNAFVTVTDERARKAAERAERAVEAGERLGPLHGVPIAIKDLDDVAGVRTTSGSLLFEDRVAEENSPVVDRLLDAGAIVVGKTNTPEFGLGCTTDNRVAGPTGTPFAVHRVSGGSSGGAGAALADGLVPLAQGSDTGGSIRTPASFCGVFGLKPTFGRVAKVDRGNAFGHHTPFSHLGPLARSVEDAALMLDVTAGPHPLDPFSLAEPDVEYAAATRRPVDDLSIAYSPDLGIYPIEPAVRRVLDDAVLGFEAAGASVERIDLDPDLDQDDVLDAYYTFAVVSWESLFDRIAEDGPLDPRGADRDRLAESTVATVLEAEDVSTREYKAADRTRTRVLELVQDVLEGHDLLVTPTLAVPPFEIDDLPTEVDGQPIEPRRGWLLTQPFNMTGHPAASVPAGFTDGGLPVGMQVVGRRLADDDVLAASAAFERVRPWRDRYPYRRS
jgi:Asp-tRNA(Asn)/Glu-tRNA(Gln) amidotransferase A subunit family amidase